MARQGGGEDADELGNRKNDGGDNDTATRQKENHSVIIASFPMGQDKEKSVAYEQR